MSWKYEDIVNLPHHVSSKRMPMPMIDRGAQFSPFAALTGHDEAIRETARLTAARIELTDSEKIRLNEKLRMLMEQSDAQPEITLTYFCPDARKSGGAYVTRTGQIRKIDEYCQTVFFTDGTSIPMEEICKIE